MAQRLRREDGTLRPNVDKKRHPLLYRLVDWMTRSGRNDRLFDLWSVVHLLTGVLAAWVMDPFIALLILVLWEPLEILVISPLMLRWFKIEFGYESIRNAMSDILFDAAGVAIGFWLLRPLIEPPFYLF